jgi:hypothetical protein
MGRSLRAAVSTLLLAASLTGCRTAAPPQEVATDVAAYLDRVSFWSPIEGETGRSIERILATQFVEESAVLHELDECIPRTAAHLRRIQAYQPRTSPLQAVHEKYLLAWTTLDQGFAQLQDGIRRAEGSALAEGREALLAWRRGLRTVAADLLQLQRDYPTPRANRAETVVR